MTPESFGLSRGTRQGCPLSPLLFVMILEPLAISIRNHPGIKGIHISDQEHQISLFADDILLYLLDLKNSIPALFLNKQERRSPTIQHPFSVAKDGFKYLGITITPQIKNIIPCNYDPIIAQINDSLDRWMSHRMSLQNKNGRRLVIRRKPYLLIADLN